MTDQLAPFDSARLKLARARQHISDLRRKAQAFLNATTIRMVIDQTPQWAELDIQIIVARGWKPPPTSLSAIIGDAVHNLRTALDLLGSDLVRLNGKSTKNVYFPFAFSAPELRDQIKAKNFDRASPEAVRLLKEIAPYEAGNRFLRAVHDLDIQDKHQALIPAMSAGTIPPMVLVMGAHPNQLPAWDSPLTHDEQIMVMMPRTPNIPLGTELPNAITLRFGADCVLAKSELFEALESLYENVARTIEAFAALAPGATFPPRKASADGDPPTGPHRALLIGSGSL